MRTIRLLKQSVFRRFYAVMTGDRVQYASRDRSLAEAYYHGQEPGTALLLSVRVVLPGSLSLSPPRDER